MSPSQILKEELEEFDKRFGKRGPDGNCDSIGRGAGCDDCSFNVRLREEHKEFVAEILTTHTLNILKAERERLEERQRIKAQMVYKSYDDASYNSGYLRDIQDQIFYLDQEIKNIEENK